MLEAAQPFRGPRQVISRNITPAAREVKSGAMHSRHVILGQRLICCQGIKNRASYTRVSAREPCCYRQQGTGSKEAVTATAVAAADPSLLGLREKIACQLQGECGVACLAGDPRPDEQARNWPDRVRVLLRQRAAGKLARRHGGEPLCQRGGRDPRQPVELSVAFDSRFGVEDQ